MHIIIGVLTGLVTIFYLLDRLGIDIGGLNPFYWRRRRAWAKKYQGDPIYSIEDPMHVAAVLIVGAAKLDGDLTAESKKAALLQFKSRFSLETSGASELLGSAAHLLGSPQVIDKQLSGVIEKNHGRFSKEQAESMIEMMTEVAAADGELSPRQKEFIDALRSHYLAADEEQGTW
ncbi:MAG TPA: TerB family tellurite resistance protein [Woeseiaceae bacterium]|nr:TerB family tellurite resistance protein [Woeseiaceae bacterium]